MEGPLAKLKWPCSLKDEFQAYCVHSVYMDLNQSTAILLYGNKTNDEPMEIIHSQTGPTMEE